MARIRPQEGAETAPPEAPPASVAAEPPVLGRIPSRPPTAQDRIAEWDDTLPDVGGGRVERPAFPRVPPASPFVLVFTPNRWDVLEGYLVPVLYKLSLAPGVNGITRAGRGGQVNTAVAIAETEQRGDTVLPWEIGGIRYIRGWPVGLAEDRKTGATVKIYSWHTAWERLWPDSDQITSDTKGYAAWLHGLIESGVLPRPRSYVVDNLLRKYETALYKRMEKDGNEIVLDDFKRRIGVLNAEIQRQLATNRPAVPDMDALPDIADPSVVVD